jgi:hypothetical protein
MSDTPTQFLAHLAALDPTEAIDFSRLETDVVDGVFCPPLKEGDEIIRERQSRRPARNKYLHDEVIPSFLLSYNPTTRTYKTTMRRLAAHEHLFNTLITVRDEDGGEVKFRLVRVTRSPQDWRTMVFKSIDKSRQLIVVNTDARGSETDVAVMREGSHWIAVFGFSPENRNRVEAAGFVFCPVERRWQTQDARVAAILDPAMRAQLRRCEAEVREVREPPRRAVFGRWWRR